MSRQTLDPKAISRPKPSVATASSEELIREVGPRLVTALFSAVKTLRLYETNNRAAQRALGDLSATIREISQVDGTVDVSHHNGFVCINETRLSVDSQQDGPFEFLVEEFLRRGVHRLEFAHGIAADELGEFLRLFLASEGATAFDTLEVGIAEQGIANVKVTRYEETETQLREVDETTYNLRLESNRVYFRTVALMGDILRTNQERQALNMRKAKRLTQRMVDIIQTDESMLVGLSSIRNFDAYTFAHSVNVCILAMLMGDRLKLPRREVAKLGVAALLHDLGKTYVPASILNCTGELSDDQWELMKYHTFFGVKELSRMKSLRDSADPMFVALQHHIHFNNNGYPRRPDGWNLRLFSRIVTIADYFDAMTAVRTYRKDPITPDRALKFILEKSGQIFDPTIAKVFVRAMGLYPVGTVVELTSGQRGVVVKQNEEARFIHRPQVEVLKEDAQTTELVDLSTDSEVAPDGRSIVRSIEDDEIGFKKHNFFLAQ